ncbi:MAG TPA: c-type cytochrome [Candidatus Aquilonibacter sp.]|nr:c-type cytochrome [Candidatus Aquilonibacter sp.]
MIFTIPALVLALTAPVQGDSGESLYMTHCSSCHGDNGQGSDVAPSIIGKSAADIHLMLDTGRMPAAVPYINEIHKMPRFTQAQMTQIVRYVQTFTPGGTDSALPRIMPGNVQRGRALFDENCAHCHGAVGNGASVGYDNVAPSLMNASVFQVGEAIRSGPELMPRFGPDVLSDQDVSDIAHYINYIQTTPASVDAGGLSLAHVGPVAEGLVAWIFGIGLLVLFIRSIGTSTMAPPRADDRSSSAR